MVCRLSPCSPSLPSLLRPPNFVFQPSENTSAAIHSLTRASQIFSGTAASGFSSVQLSPREEGWEKSKALIALLSLGWKQWELIIDAFLCSSHSKGTLQAPRILLCISPLPPSAPAVWVVSLILKKNDEFTTNNPQVGVISNLSTLRFLVRSGVLTGKVRLGTPELWPICHPHALRDGEERTGSEFSI